MTATLRPMKPCNRPGCSRLTTGAYCDQDKPTEEQRGYGRSWRALRSIGRARARCENCGSRQRLHRDHVVPKSLGGTDAATNLRWLCASCHSKIGVRSNANRGAL